MSIISEMFQFDKAYKVNVHANYYEYVKGKNCHYFNDILILVMATTFFLCSCDINQTEMALTEGKWYCDASQAFYDEGVDGECECTLQFAKDNENREMLLKIEGECNNGTASMKFRGSVRGTWDVEYDTLIMNLSPNTIKTKIIDVDYDFEYDVDGSIREALITELNREIRSMMIMLVQDVEKKQGKSQITINNGKMSLDWLDGDDPDVFINIK